MKNNKKSVLTLGVTIFLILIVVGIVVISSPTQLNHMIYLLFPSCWSCEERVWNLDATHPISFNLPESWTVEEDDDQLFIRPPDQQNNMLIYIGPVELENEVGTGLINILDAYINQLLANHEYTLTEPIQIIDMKGEEVARAQVRAEVRVTVDEGVQADLEEMDATPLLPTITDDFEFILADYRGHPVVIWASWEEFIPQENPWEYDQLRMIMDSIRFE